MMNMGVAASARGDLNDAIEAYSEARRIREQTGTLETPGGALLMMNIGIAMGARQALLMRHIGVEKRARKDADVQLEHFAEARRIFDRTGTLETPDGALLLTNMGI